MLNGQLVPVSWSPSSFANIATCLSFLCLFLFYGYQEQIIYDMVCCSTPEVKPQTGPVFHACFAAPDLSSIFDAIPLSVQRFPAVTVPVL